ncbi:hypothetical protein PENANT_c094G11259 [Penicillium antarcticum]|uniref:Uncharacterized protein n=1 Tax=Penicillium antarcticum TaxID=416450 RepID=A0A1V6PNC6_9EURO|nr:hypothetical protein PENANT_c094G11259 [Penicillium antarcticum]
MAEKEGLAGLKSHYDALVSGPLEIRYIAKFMHQPGLLAQLQHAAEDLGPEAKL